MVELLMAIVIFGIAATAIMSGFLTALKSTRSDRNRIQASSLAAREIEITRNEFNATTNGPANLQAADYLVDPHPLPGGTAGSALVVDKTGYTVVRNVEPLIAGTGVSPCDGGSAVAYPQFQVTATVTWPSMAGVQPVTNTTVLTPPKGTISSTYGYVAVKVLNAAGAASPGRTVTISGPGGTDTDVTGPDGCAVFPEATAGTYTASLNDSGYVDYYGVQAPTKTTPVTAGTLKQLSFSYDKKVRLDVTLSTDSGYALPSGYSTVKPTVVIANTGLQPSGIKASVLTGTNSGSLDGLWPFTDGYTVWVGSCTQSDPAATGGSRGASTVMAPGTNAPTTIRLAPVKVTVMNGAGLPQTGLTVVAAPPSPFTGCVASENPLTLGTTDSTGTLMTSLPAGSWKIQVVGKTPSPTWPSTASLQATSAPSTVAVVVG